MAAAMHGESQIPLQMSSTSPVEESSIAVLESGGEMKKIYSQHHDLNNNGGNIYQNLTPIHSSHVKSESHSPIDGASKILTDVDCKTSESAGSQMSSNELNLENNMSNERPRCWTKI